MSTATKLNLVSAEDYLAGEMTSRVKHEYLGGVLYAMARARNVHNSIATNTIGELRSRLRGRPCRPFNSDPKIRIQLPGHVRFYHADALVTCAPNPPTDSFQDEPAVIFEVLSRATRRIDEGEEGRILVHPFAARLWIGRTGVSRRGGVPPRRPGI
jgi:Uma2 family endonuclease